MRQDGDGRDQMQTRSYAPGERVFGAIDGVAGTVVSVDDKFDTFLVKWDDGSFPVVYDQATILVRRGFPWE
jgi:hypothetical protein